MAGRTSTSVGVGITVTLLGILTLGLFVSTLIFYSQKNAAERNLANATENSKDYITDQERNSDAVRQLVTLGKNDRKSAMGYLLSSQGEIMSRVTGSRNDNLADFNRKLDNIQDASSSNLLAIIQDKSSSLVALEQQVKDAVAARQRALADRENEARRVKDIEDSQAKTRVALQGEIDKYKDEVDRMRENINTLRVEMDKRVDDIKAAAQSREDQLAADNERLQKERALDKARIAELEKLTGKQRYTGLDEASLVDGRIIGMDAGSANVFISLGKRDRLTLGMTFEVYSDTSNLRPDEEGRIPPGKGSIEVIRIDEQSAICRVLREKKGNSIIKGDVLVNAVYDPKKTYKFVVFGNFDSNRDGKFSPAEAADVRAKIATWRGEVVEDLSGDVDFLVLGERPSLPPEPSRSAPLEVVQQYIRLKQMRDRYDELLTRAGEAAIPVLNLNRLETLTGSGL